ncbi:MAG: glycosyltransferase family 2 protein [Patescibacteria group bacterium]|jgi:GalNAc5-diNAcBac-PP-undecaprenol beta-1,3-glucosyltransferase|nr:glycosyltransferase family 2 protein [Patescibacteria group bacterium]
MTPRFSIITPTFNRADIIKNAIESIISQTFINWEMLIIDDASNDNTKKIVEEYIAIDNRIKYFSFLKNVGPNIARNFGILRASGEWLVFLDSDDSLMADALKIINQYINKFPNVSIFLFNCRDLVGNIPINIADYEGPVSYKDFLCGKIKGEALTVVKKDLFLPIMFPINIRGGESIAWIKLLKKNSCGYFVKHVLRIYNNKRDDRLSIKKNNFERIYQVHKEFLKNFYKDLLMCCPFVLIIYFIKLIIYRILCLLKKLIN